VIPQIAGPAPFALLKDEFHKGLAREVWPFAPRLQVDPVDDDHHLIPRPNSSLIGSWAWIAGAAPSDKTDTTTIVFIKLSITIVSYRISLI
jgi:hypothetical protein